MISLSRLMRVSVALKRSRSCSTLKIGGYLLDDAVVPAAIRVGEAIFTNTC